MSRIDSLSPSGGIVHMASVRYPCQGTAEESCAWQGRDTPAKEQAWESSTTRSRGFPRDLVLSDQPTAHQGGDGGNQPDELDEQADPVGDPPVPIHLAGKQRRRWLRG